MASTVPFMPVAEHNLPKALPYMFCTVLPYVLLARHCGSDYFQSQPSLSSLIR